jgi:hypothetical protein
MLAAVVVVAMALQRVMVAQEVAAQVYIQIALFWVIEMAQ